MDAKKVGMDILGKVGGESNVNHLTHCATRLRFTLKDKSLVDQKISDMPEVLGVVDKGPQFQVIIGNEVSKVYDVINNDLNLDSKGSDVGEDKSNKKLLDSFIDVVTGIFTPILPALTAAGMLKAVLGIIVAFKLIDNESQTFQIISFMADATFFFLPILLASSSAKRFKTNQYLAMMLGGILVHPNFIAMVNTAKEAGEGIKFFGMPVYLATYSSTVIPIILGVFLMSKVEPLADKVSPNAVKFFTKPLITIGITGAMTILVLGPVGFIFSNFIADSINALDSVAGWIVPTVIGIITPLLVIVGAHHGLLPIGINNRMTIGYDTIVYPGQLSSNIAQGAAALATSIRTKDATLKQLASATGITAVCGITEPVLYGVTIKYKTNMIATMLGGGAAGLFMGLSKVKNFSGGAPGLLTLPSYISVESPMSNFYFAAIGCAIAFVISFATSFVLFKDVVSDELEVNNDTEPSTVKITNAEVLSPAIGEYIKLENVNDTTFSSGMLGKGFGILPSENEIFSPVSGIIESIFPTKHAITLLSDERLEILVHIGIDSVSLDGKGIISHVKEKQRVKKGDLIAEIDPKVFDENEIDKTVITVVLNSAELKSEFCDEDSKLNKNDVVMKLV